jgi:DNA-binding MarR family transcriptional regulator
VTTGRGDEVAEIVMAWQRERPRDDVSSIRVVTPLWRLGAALQQARAGALSAFGLDESRLDVLGTLRRSGTPYRLSAGELTRRCRVTAGATTQRVQRLEEDGYVERVRDEHDRRRVVLEMTPAAMAAGGEFFGGLQRDLAAAMDSYSDEELDVVRRFLAEMTDVIVRHQVAD